MNISLDEALLRTDKAGQRRAKVEPADTFSNSILQDFKVLADLYAYLTNPDFNDKGRKNHPALVAETQ